MNFKIKLRKTAPSPAVLAIEFLQNDYMLHYDHFYLTSDQIEKSFDYDLELDKFYVLRISRHEQEFYQTNKLVHDSYVIVEEIMLDNFWTIDHKNQWSKTVYDTKYKHHLNDKPATWELSKDQYNNTLFFNGSLDYSITSPIRGMFFK
jgi:hypothetical protein